MLQLQYLKLGLKNNHVNKILNNYRIKYTQIKNEMESKINQMIKLFLNDISQFLENLEEVSEQKHKISEYDSVLKDLELARAKIKDKITSEHKLKNECDMLQQENCMLKLKINSLNHKIKNMGEDNISNSLAISPIKVKSKRNYMSPRAQTSKNFFKEPINGFSHRKSGIISPIDSELNKYKKEKENIDKLTLKLNYDKMVKSKNKFNNKNNKKSNVTKTINNKVSIKPIKDANSKNFNFQKKDSKVVPINKLTKKNLNLNTSVEQINYNKKTNHNSPLNTINQTIEIPVDNKDILDYEYLGQKINDTLNSELKELSQDEENIELLLEQLEDFNEI